LNAVAVVQDDHRAAAASGMAAKRNGAGTGKDVLAA
jgi:hypothetical protein